MAVIGSAGLLRLEESGVSSKLFDNLADSKDEVKGRRGKGEEKVRVRVSVK